MEPNRFKLIMRRYQWKTKQLAGIAVLILVLFLLFRPWKYEHKESAVIKNVKPNTAFEFVADFSNMKYLNPTIVDFTILSESGNFDHWKYAVEYSEHLSHWPYLYNKAVAKFDIRSSWKKGLYTISSMHETCLFNGHFCLNSESEFMFTAFKSPVVTLCEEYIQFECPMILQGFCRREVEWQRKEIMANLKNKFMGGAHGS